MRRLMVGLLMAAIGGMSVTGVLADDQEIARSIVEGLRVKQQQGQLKGFNIGVRVDNGDVWIEGQVAEPSQQSMVLDTARRIPGVKQVVNGIQVTPEEPVASLAALPPAATSPAVVQTERPIAKQPATPPAVVQTERPTAKQPATPPAVAQTERPVATQPALQPAFAQSKQPAPKNLLSSWENALGSAMAQTAKTAADRPKLETPSAMPEMRLPNPVSLPETGVVSASNERLVALANSAPPAPAVAPPSQAPQQMSRAVRGTPVAFAPARQVSMTQPINAAPVPAYVPGTGGGVAPAVYDHPNMPGYAWPAYASYPNYAGLTYPKQYSPTAWPYIGPFYPYPQVPLGWRKVVLEWDDGWWMLDFKAKTHY